MENQEINVLIEAQQSAEIDMQVSAGETVAAPVDATLQIAGMAADAKAAGDAIRTNAQGIQELETVVSGKVAKPVTNPNGTDGQLLRTNGDGTTQWVDQGTPTDAQVADAVDTWLEGHPEATTTVEDGAISRAKLDADLKEKTDAIHDLASAVDSADARISLLETLVDGGELSPAQLSAIAASGNADHYFSVGDIIQIPWTDTWGDTDVEYQIPFVVVNIADAYDSEDNKHEKAIWLQALRSSPNTMIFHAPDRTEVDLATETTAVSGWAYVGLTGTTYTALNLSAGASIPTTYDKVYKTTYTGLALKAVKTGIARWKDSDMRQWLNSTAAKNANWWISQYDGATPPSADYTNRPGFLGGFSADWQAVFKAVKLSTGVYLDGATSSSDVTYDKVFLPYQSNVYGATGTANNPNWPYWVSAVGGSSPSTTSKTGRVIRPLSSTSAAPWCLRSYYRATDMDQVMWVTSNGAVNNYSSGSAARVAPCVCLF